MGSARKPRAPTQGPCTAVWGHPQENPGRRPKNPAVVVAVLFSRDCFGGATHRGVSALTRIPSSKRDKIIIRSHFGSSVLPKPSRRDVLELANLVLGSHGVLQIREPMLATALPIYAPERRTACATMGRVVDFPRERGNAARSTVGHAACSEKLQHPTLRRREQFYART